MRILESFLLLLSLSLVLIPSEREIKIDRSEFPCSREREIDISRTEVYSKFQTVNLFHDLSNRCSQEQFFDKGGGLVGNKITSFQSGFVRNCLEVGQNELVCSKLIQSGAVQ